LLIKEVQEINQYQQGWMRDATSRWHWTDRMWY